MDKMIEEFFAAPRVRMYVVGLNVMMVGELEIHFGCHFEPHPEKDGDWMEVPESEVDAVLQFIREHAPEAQVSSERRE